MAVSQPTSTFGSMAPLIYGEPWVDIAAEEAIEDFPVEVEQAVKKAMLVARSYVRREAMADSEWERYSQLIDVAFSGDSIEFVLIGSPEDNAAMLALEYGAEPDFSPNPLLRRSILGAADAMSKALEIMVNV